VLGLLLLKHIYALSDEGVGDRWVYDPYFQYFTGEEFFQHVFPHERSDLTHWRNRLRDKLELLLAESLRVAHESGALRTKQQRQRGWKPYSFIGKGKASAPCVKVAIVTTNARAPGGQFVLHAKSLPGNPYDGHTLAGIIEATERLTGCTIERSYVDKGFRGHDTPNPRRIFITGQKRGVFGVIKRELRRRSAIEAVIGHMKTDGHLGRCHLKGRAGDAANALLTAVGYNFRGALKVTY
jgi:hypothetical protein